MAARESEKALRYINYLDTARCNAQWDRVPELTRKIAKHAPNRKCLILTAKTEAQVAEYTPPSLPPSTATSEGSRSPSPLSKLIAPLLAAIDEEVNFLEDAFQATICLGWVHWVLREPQLAVARLPKSVMGTLARITDLPHLSPAWIQVCAVKGAYIKGFAQEKIIGPNDALNTYRSLIPFLTSIPTTLGSLSPEFRVWTERMLSRTVAVAMKSKPLGDWMDLESMLQVFHLWMSLFRYTPTNPKLPVPYEPPRQAPSLVELGSEVDYSRWDVWMAYYETLSEILRRGYIYSPSYMETKPEILHSRDGLSEEEYINVRFQQRTEIKKVEASIESKLLEETRFPKAIERNSRVERWVDAVMQNWRIMCGPTWQDEELGEGGKNGIARGVLDILYRAATKSYHSTQILRYLYSVHAYVAEFDLAFKAFDTYVELVQRGKAREEKSGEPDYSLDNDDTVLHTASEAIRTLCRFGARKDVEKAREICSKLQEWLNRAASDTKAQEFGEGKISLPVRVPISPKAISEANRALGMCEATWARLTYDASARNGHQQKAVEHYRTSLDIQFGNNNDLETQYLLALVLAEMRELTPAIKIIKQALSRPSKPDTFSSFLANGYSSELLQHSDSVDYARERKLIPFWHLLALLLTAKADLSNAARASNAAFEQFEDPTNLFGPEQYYKSEHLNELEKPSTPKPKALIEKMERFEKEGIIQIKITQIALLEMLQSSSDAVDASAELLALYARLFGDPKAELLRAQTRTSTAKPPKSSVTTLRHSIMSRARSRKREEKLPSLAPTSTANNTRPSTMATSTTTAPTIQITSDDGSIPRGRSVRGNRHSLFRNKSHHGGRDSPQRSPSQKLHKRSASQVRKSLDSPRSAGNDTAISSDPTANGSPGSPRTEERVSNFSLPRASTATPDTKSGTASPDQSLRKIPHNFPPSKEPPPTGQYEQPPHQDIRLPAPHPASADAAPEPVFPVLQERRHKISLLTSLWLFIAGLYTRAEAFDDAKGAIDEAAELVQALENQVAQESSSARAFAARGWGGGKSIEELWGDVWAHRGELFRAQNLPYDAMPAFEKALSHSADHPAAVVGLSELLLDVYCQKNAPEPPEPTSLSLSTYSTYPTFTSPNSSLVNQALHSHPPNINANINGNGAPTANANRNNSSTNASSSSSLSSHNSSSNQNSQIQPQPPTTKTLITTSPSPELLNRLAARDRAYALLSTLTKLGTGWDYAEAWYALARVYEESGQLGKAKEVLWWVVELEDSRPVRGWGVVGGGLGFF